MPVVQWTHPDFTPVFEVPAASGPVWLRISNHPAPTSAFVQLVTSGTLEQRRHWTYLLLGGYLGFGVPPRIPAWGTMISSGQHYVDSAWRLSAVPGAAILVLVPAVNLFGEGLRDALDPRLQD